MRGRARVAARCVTNTLYRLARHAASAGDGPSRALCGVHLKQAKWTKVAKPTSRCEKVLCTKNRAHDRHTLSRNSESRMVWRVADSQSWFCSVARVAGTNSGTQLAHYFVRGHGFAVELEWSPSVPRSAFLITYVVKLPRSRLGPGITSGCPSYIPKTPQSRMGDAPSDCSDCAARVCRSFGCRIRPIPKNPLRPDSMKLTPEGKRPTLIQAIN